MEKKTTQDFMLGALLGGTVGTAAALLLAPVPGNQLRQKMTQKMGKLQGNKKALRAGRPQRLEIGKQVGQQVGKQKPKSSQNKKITALESKSTRDKSARGKSIPLTRRKGSS